MGETEDLGARTKESQEKNRRGEKRRINFESNFDKHLF